MKKIVCILLFISTLSCQNNRREKFITVLTNRNKAYWRYHYYNACHTLTSSNSGDCFNINHTFEFYYCHYDDTDCENKYRDDLLPLRHWDTIDDSVIIMENRHFKILYFNDTIVELRLSYSHAFADSIEILKKEKLQDREMRVDANDTDSWRL